MNIKSTANTHDHIEDKSLIWEIIKFDIRNYIIIYSSQENPPKNCVLNDLNKRYNDLHTKVLSDEAEELKNIKHELELIEEIHKARGAMLRSKCKWTEEGEKNPSYFLRLEKHNYCNKNISQLEINNKIISNPGEILKAQGNFFKELYMEKIQKYSDIFNEKTNQFTESDNISKISEESRNICDSDLTESELLVSLKELKNSRSPGSDGLVVIFYFFLNG